LAGGSRATGTTSQGRWPANIFLDSAVAAALDEQSGVLTSGNLSPYREQHESASRYQFHRDKTYTKEGDTGGASRFFHQVSEFAE